jgi:hypothetical protein
VSAQLAAQRRPSSIAALSISFNAATTPASRNSPAPPPQQRSVPRASPDPTSMTDYFFVNPGDDQRGPPAGGRRLTSSKSGAGLLTASQSGATLLKGTPAPPRPRQRPSSAGLARSASAAVLAPGGLRREDGGGGVGGGFGVGGAVAGSKSPLAGPVQLRKPRRGFHSPPRQPPIAEGGVPMRRSQSGAALPPRRLEEAAAGGGGAAAATAVAQRIMRGTGAHSAASLGASPYSAGNYLPPPQMYAKQRPPTAGPSSANLRADALQLEVRLAEGLQALKELEHARPYGADAAPGGGAARLEELSQRKLALFRSLFDAVIEREPAMGGLLRRIKAEYEAASLVPKLGAAPKASYQEEFEAHEAAAAAAAGAPEAFDTSAIDAMLYAKDPSRR